MANKDITGLLKEILTINCEEVSNLNVYRLLEKLNSKNIYIDYMTKDIDYK